MKTEFKWQFVLASKTFHDIANKTYTSPVKHGTKGNEMTTLLINFPVFEFIAILQTEGISYWYVILYIGDHSVEVSELKCVQRKMDIVENYDYFSKFIVSDL